MRQILELVVALVMALAGIVVVAVTDARDVGAAVGAGLIVGALLLFIHSQSHHYDRP